MSKKEFGAIINEALPVRNYIAEIREIVAIDFPLLVTKDIAGNLIGVTYETEWQEGGTTPIINKKGEVVGYKPDYESKSLTKKKTKRIDENIKKTIAFK